MNKLLTSIIALSFYFISGTLSAADDRSIYLVRHAEKQETQDKDPSLTSVGEKRALNLAAILRSKNITEVYSSGYNRTRQTAQPLADALGIKVQEYDPRKLAEFADKVKASSHNMLIVGHSNTTPMLSYLLGGDAIGDIDESEYGRLYELTLSSGKVTTQLLPYPPHKNKVVAGVLDFDATKFEDMKLKFKMSFNGNPVGESTMTLAQNNDEFVLHEKTIIKGMNIDADIETIADVKTLAPVRMSMTGSMGAPVDIQLSWEQEQVLGHSQMTRAPYKQQGKIEVAKPYPQHAVERTSLIMLAHLVVARAEKPQNIEWFDAYSAELKHIEISHVGDAKVTVPAGTFETYKVQYLGGAPSQVFYVAKGKQPKVVKIEVIGMPWTYELL